MSRLLLADVGEDLRVGLGVLQRGLAAFRETGLLDAAAVHTVTGIARALAARAGRAAPPVEVGLALALAVQAPRQGHVAVDLAAVAPREGSEPSPLPADRESWRVQVAESPLVREADSEPASSPFVLRGTLLYTRRSWGHQQRLGRALRERMARPLTPPRHPERLADGLDWLFRPPDDTPHDPAGPLNRQRLAAAQALLGHYCVVTGGPGMGKTWTVRNLLTLMLLEHFEEDPERPPLRIALAAPTGNAPARMWESLSQGLDPAWYARLARVAGAGTLRQRVQETLEQLQASTLHRLLGVVSYGAGPFRHTAADPLPVDVVVVDEASMVDLALMDRLVDALPAHARLVLMGDRDQLASVEAGRVLADLCGPTRSATAVVSRARARALEALGLPVREQAPVAGAGGLALVDEEGPWDHVVQLDRMYRFEEDSGIATFVGACLAGDEVFDARAAAAVLTDPARTDVATLAHGRSGTLAPRLAELLVDGEGDLSGFGAAYDLLFRGWTKSRYPTEAAFHRAVLDRFARVRVLCAHRRGRVGVAGFNDRIAALLERRVGALKRSGSFWAGRPVLVLRNDRASGLYNGDLGLVVRASFGGGRALRVVFPGPDSLPQGPLGPDDVLGLRLVRYVAPARLPEHQTTFAMTIHKSQGSEFDHAVVVLPEERSRVLTRELIYTGVTRARKRVTLVGSPEVLVQALDHPVERWSGLREALWGAGGS